MRVWFLVILPAVSCTLVKNNDNLLGISLICTGITVSLVWAGHFLHPQVDSKLDYRKSDQEIELGNKRKITHYIITCHTTDFECFKRQYKALRDNVLLGNVQFGIPTYEHYVFAYAGGTCVKLAGLEESKLVAISMLSPARRFVLVIELPLRIQQVKDTLKTCAKPEKPFKVKKPQSPAMMRFTGNATISIMYPYNLKKMNGLHYMSLEDENLDVILDIPDLGHFHKKSVVQAQLYEWSEWAYEVVQHVDAAEYFALPYTTQLRTLMDRVPLQRLIMLYPEETYEEIYFTFSEANVRRNA